MKAYDRLMSDLVFREDFCEDTLAKATQQKKGRSKPVKWATVAACICLCTALLFGTAVAVSPGLRAILIPNSHISSNEEPLLPTEPNSSAESNMDILTARYYKLDGELAASSGFGSVFPVKSKGSLSFYTITEEGELQKAGAPRRIQKDITYKWRTWSLDLELYRGEVLTIRDEELIYPLEEGSPLTLGRWEDNVWMPILVDPYTFEIEDPVGNITFVPDEDAHKTYIHGNPDSTTVLIRSELANEQERYYYGNNQSGQVLLLGEGEPGQWSVWGDRIYSYEEGILSQWTEKGTALPLFGGKPCSYDQAGFAYCWEGSDLRVLDLESQGSYLLADLADSFPNPVFTHNRVGTKFCIANADPQVGSLGVNAIAMVDRETGTMVTLDRDPSMKERMMGWLDHDRFLICGTIDEQWYICLYEME